MYCHAGISKNAIDITGAKVMPLFLYLKMNKVWKLMCVCLLIPSKPTVIGFHLDSSNTVVRRTAEMRTFAVMSHG